MSLISSLVIAQVVPNYLTIVTESLLDNTMTSPSAQVLKKCPNDFIFGRVLGEGSFSTVQYSTVECLFYL